MNHCLDGNLRTYAATKESKANEFTINSQDINQGIGIQRAIILEIKLQKSYDHVLRGCSVLFEPLLEWEHAYVCQD